MKNDYSGSASGSGNAVRELSASREPVSGMLAAEAGRVSESSSGCGRVRSARRVERRMDLRSQAEVLVGVAKAVGVAGVAGGVETSAVEASVTAAAAKGEGAVAGGSEAPRNAQPLARSHTLQRRSTTRCQ